MAAGSDRGRRSRNSAAGCPSRHGYSHDKTGSATARGTNRVTGATNATSSVTAGSGGGSRRKVEGWREQQQALHRIVDFLETSRASVRQLQAVPAARARSRLSEEQRRAAWEEQHERAGQFLAKPDMSPPAWVRRLAPLHDSAPADPFPLVRRTVEAELARADVAGSDVHMGRLKDGRRVAIKVTLETSQKRPQFPPLSSPSAFPFILTPQVQRAGAERLMLMDLANLRLYHAHCSHHSYEPRCASSLTSLLSSTPLHFHPAPQVQRAGAERLMLMDLANLRLFGAFLQRAELKVDLLGPISELEQQIRYEFDFEHEAAAMERIRHALAQRDGGETAGGRWERHGGMRSSRRTGRHGVGRGGISRANRVERVERVETLGRVEHAGKKARPEDRQGAHVIVQGGAEGGGRSAEMDTRASPVIVPAAIPGLVTRGLLVMDFIDGTPILRLPEEMRKRGISPSGALARQTKSPSVALAKETKSTTSSVRAYAAGLQAVQALSTAYGCMLLQHGHFQADPHPGNILVCAVGRVALLDYGQTKQLHEALWLNLARSSPPSHRHNLNLLPFPLPPRCSRIFSALSTAYGRMLLQHGHFHADPHPGNILVYVRGRQVALLDYGQTKQLPEALRLNLARLVVAIADEDMLA
ncbi:unnamed protein product, partial [Closterium sp. NIES-65]